MMRWKALAALVLSVLTLLGAGFSVTPALAEDRAPSRAERIHSAPDGTAWKWFDQVKETPPNADIMVGRSMHRDGAYAGNVRVDDLRIYGRAMFSWSVYGVGDVRILLTKGSGVPLKAIVQERRLDSTAAAKKWTTMPAAKCTPTVRWDVFMDIVGARLPESCVPWMVEGFGDISYITVTAAKRTDQTLDPVNK